MPTKSRLTSEYLAAALPLGLQVRRCDEPRRPFPLVDDSGESIHGDPDPEHVPGEPPNIWAPPSLVPGCDERCLSRHALGHHLALPARL